MRAGLLALVSALILSGTVAAAPPDTTKAGSADVLPVYETLLAGLSVVGERLMDRLAVSDLDIIAEGETRFLPVLRLIDVLRIRVDASGEEMIFFSPSREQVRLNPKTGHLAIAGIPVEARVRVGISDLTNHHEVWVEEAVAGRILGLALEWREDSYAYDGKPLGPIPAFERREGESRRRITELTSLGFELPEPHSPAAPGRDVLGINFLNLRARGSAFLIQNSKGQTEVNPFASVALSGWGPFLGGDYQVTVSATGGGTQSFGHPILERATWTLRGNSTEMSVGDRVFGLSTLVFPSVNTAGVFINTLTGVSDPTYQRDLSQLGSQPVFQPSLEVSGEAPVGSRVELRINRQLVDEVIVKEDDGSSPGRGIYRFRGVYLLTGRANHARILITHPDGSEEEIHRQIIGSSDLLRAGQLALVGGGGMKRNPSAGTELDPLYGQFGGFRGLVGVTKNLTAGVSAAWQDEFSSQIYSQRSFDPDVITPQLVPPRSSMHAGGQASWRVLSPLLVAVEGAWMEAPDDNEEGTAWTTETRLQFGQTSLGLHGFTFSTDYFNGTNERIADRRGVAFDGGFQITPRTRLNALAARAEDNVDRSRPVTITENMRRIELNSGQFVPRATTTLHGAFVTYSKEDTRALAGVEIDGALLRRLSYRVTYFEGDDLRSNQDLLEGINLPGVFTFEIPRRYLELSVGLSRGGTLKASHNETRGFRRTLLGHTLATSGGPRPYAWTIEAGYDWSSDTPIAIARVDYFLDRSKTGRLGLDVRRNPGGAWSLGLSIEHQGLVSFLGGGTRFLLGSRLNPDRGGVKGIVFHDFDADGILDEGEPGLPGIRVITERGTAVTSGQRGEFFLTNTGAQRLLRVSFDAEALPASFTPTNGTQLATIRNGSFTPIHLGLASLASLSGYVRVEGPDGTLSSLAGVRVLLLDAKGTQVNHSITANDGSYYFGEVKTGDYTVLLDAETLDDRVRAEVTSLPIRVVADEEFEEVEGIDFKLTRNPTSAP